jgi:hypothetical protein
MRFAQILLAMALLVTTVFGGGRRVPTPQIKVSVAVTPSAITVGQGDTMKFQVGVSGHSNQAVTWSVAGSPDAGTIDANGLYTAPRSNYQGPIKVLAVSQAAPLVTGTASVTVPWVRVTISPDSFTLKPQETKAFSATVSGLADTNVTWSVENIRGGSISNAGFYTAPLVAGVYHVIATSTASHYSATATIAVTTSSGSFTPARDMQKPRGLHTATLLADGSVLMAGGVTPASCLGGMPSAELYDPVSGLFVLTGTMTRARYAHTATLLPNKQVLIAGGFGRGCPDTMERALGSAELFDPAKGQFTVTGSMAAGRAGHTATLLRNGKVLITGGGGFGGYVFPFFYAGSISADLFDPATGVFTSTGNMEEARFGHTASLLADGKVLIVGGFATGRSTPITLAEIYDPATGRFTSAGHTFTAHAGHTATSLVGGKVLIAGGIKSWANSITASSAAETYDPATGSFLPAAPMGLPRYSHTATLQPDGTVLMAGGHTSRYIGTSTAELFNPATRSFSTTGGMETKRTGHTATLLGDGKTLVAGSATQEIGKPTLVLSSTELFK